MFVCVCGGGGGHCSCNASLSAQCSEKQQSPCEGDGGDLNFEEKKC